MACILILASSLAGCRERPITFVDESRDYELEATARVLEEVDAPELDQERSVADLRTDALTSLRNEGDKASQAADLITKTFPSDTRAVPFYVERATVGEEAVWLVAEAIGRTGAPLEDERIWVITDEGYVLFSATE